MSKILCVTNTFNISSNDSFNTIAKHFKHALAAVEEQGYATKYRDEVLYQPGQIGVIGRPASGKSTFMNAAVGLYFPDADITYKHHPNYNQTRTIQVWKRWISKEKDFEVRIQDSEASSALMHMKGILLPDNNVRGINIYEHPNNPDEFCDMILEFRYSEDKQRYLDIRTTPDVSENQHYRDAFLPHIDNL